MHLHFKRSPNTFTFLTLESIRTISGPFGTSKQKKAIHLSVEAAPECGETHMMLLHGSEKASFHLGRRNAVKI